MRSSNVAMKSIFNNPPVLPIGTLLFEWFPVVVLAVCVVFLQGYALVFWTGLLGKAGWGVSLGLEVIHLWAWFRAAVSARFSRLAWMILAFAATGLLLAGALREVSKPLLLDSARIEAASQQWQSLEAESGVLKANLTAFRDMAATQGRRGWRDDIRRDTARLQAITEKLQTLTNQSGKSGRRPWLNQATQGGVVAVAVLFQIAAVLASVEPFGRQSKCRKTVSG